MKRLVAFLSVFFAVQAVATAPPDAGVISIMVSGGSSGHACAVNGLVITNRHMVDPRPRNDFTPPHSLKFRYEFLSGQSGRGRSLRISSVADLAVVELDKEPPYGYAKLGKAPKVGEKIHWFEYDFRKRKDLYEPRRREGKISMIIAGHIIILEDIVGGASGSCAIDENDEVIGIMTFGVSGEDRRTSAGVTSIYGDWWKDLE